MTNHERWTVQFVDTDDPGVSGTLAVMLGAARETGTEAESSDTSPPPLPLPTQTIFSCQSYMRSLAPPYQPGASCMEISVTDAAC